MVEVGIRERIRTRRGRMRMHDTIPIPLIDEGR